jgi:hypothetical protein
MWASSSDGCSFDNHDAIMGMRPECRLNAQQVEHSFGHKHRPAPQLDRRSLARSVSGSK